MVKLICVSCAGMAFAEATTPPDRIKPVTGEVVAGATGGGVDVAALLHAASVKVNARNVVQNIFFHHDSLFRFNLHFGAHAPA